MKLRKYVPIEPVVVILKGRPFTLTPNDTIHIGKTINHIVEGEWMGYPITFNDSELKKMEHVHDYRAWREDDEE